MDLNLDKSVRFNSVVSKQLVCSSFDVFVIGQLVDKRLVWCPHCHRVLWSSASSPSRVFTWLKCDVDDAHCDFKGRRLKFKPSGSGTRVAWVCPKLCVPRGVTDG